MDDTDGDGTKDRAEIIAGTAHAPDEDGDGTADWVQSVRDADMDADGLSDGEEMWLGTNLLDRNSDGDDIDDSQETQFGGDLGRSPSVMDGAPEIRVPDQPENPDITPDLDTSDPGTIPQAMTDFEDGSELVADAATDLTVDDGTGADFLA
jgi:hypothetical protein